MHVLCLPGYTRKTNEEEYDQIVERLRQGGHEVDTFHWRHWDRPDAGWDPEEELRRIGETVDRTAKTYAVVAKSVATYVATLLLERDRDFREKVSRIVFLGVPVRDTELLEPDRYRQVLPEVRAKLTIIQNRDDPHGPVSEMVDTLDGIPYILLERSGEDHRYPYTEETAQALK